MLEAARRACSCARDASWQRAGQPDTRLDEGCESPVADITARAVTSEHGEEIGDPKRLQAVNFGARDRPSCYATRRPNILTRISCGVVARRTASRHTSTTLSEIPIVSYIHDLELDS